jgi:hypothetical protein
MSAGKGASVESNLYESSSDARYKKFSGLTLLASARSPRFVGTRARTQRRSASVVLLVSVWANKTFAKNLGNE